MRAAILEDVWLQRLTLQDHLLKMKIDVDLLTKELCSMRRYVNQLIKNGESDQEYVFFIDYTWKEDSTKMAQYVLSHLPKAKVIICCDKDDDYMYMPVAIADSVLVTVRPYKWENILRAVTCKGRCSH